MSLTDQEVRDLVGDSAEAKFQSLVKSRGYRISPYAIRGEELKRIGSAISTATRVRPDFVAESAVGPVLVDVKARPWVARKLLYEQAEQIRHGLCFPIVYIFASAGFSGCWHPVSVNPGAHMDGLRYGPALSPHATGDDGWLVGGTIEPVDTWWPRR